MVEKERITISFPESDEYLLEEIDQMVDEGQYEDRTDVILSALQPDKVDDTTLLYDSAVSALYSAERQEKHEIAENAQEHIIEQFPRSRMAGLLENKEY